MDESTHINIENGIESGEYGKNASKPFTIVDAEFGKWKTRTGS
jgi:hypothetical protein